ncbi:vancomycin B-type resistance protein VanW [bacterium BMS3Bbin01]|nr:vancomycin B-type resistance protein VanW [bacterium BMS3Bbin01]
MSRTSRIIIVFLGLLAGLFIVLIGSFGIDRALHVGKVLHNVHASSVDLSGRNEAGAELALVALEDELSATPAVFDVTGTTVDLDPTTVRFDIDELRAAAAALDVGRDGTVIDQFRWWLVHIFTVETVPVHGSLDEKALSAVFDYWDESAISIPPFDGAVEVRGIQAVARYPNPGTGIDRPSASKTILASLLDPDRPIVTIETAPLQPNLGVGDIDEAVEEAQQMIGRPVVLSREDPDISVTFTPRDLASALRSQIVHNSPAHIQLSFDPEVIGAILEPASADLGVPPRNASFEVGDDGLVTIVPGRPGQIVDPELTAGALAVASRMPERTGRLPFEDAAEPEFTTEDALALNIKHLVSQFTTYHRCCQNRVTNIHLLADIIDGAIVLPGEEFSINEYVGQRDTARGFLPDHTIVQGKMVDTIGGGVSQFATTFYNAMYWGGYEDVTHSPHSYYFSRYPEGHEATISWPAPNLVFRNDSDAAVLIKTSYTDTSLTVSFYGDNGGRTVVGEQKNGRLHTEVTSEGDGTARKVTSSVSPRFDETEPPTEYTANDELLPGDEIVNVKGRVGWTVIVTRNIEYPNGHVETQEWRVRYRPQPREIEVNSCMIPPEEGQEPVPCPTTTTVASTTTTTAAG